MTDIINTINNYSNQKRGRENNVFIFGMENVKKDNVTNKINHQFIQQIKEK